jgi:hypothetical protein
MDKRGRVTISAVIVSIILVGILAVHFVLADNGITYSLDEKDSRIVNFFDINGKIGSAELKSHSSPTEIKNVMRGKDRAVMYYEFSNWKDVYINGLGNVKFVDMNTGKEIQKDYYFAKAIYEDVKINDYEKFCIDKTTNGNTSKICEDKVVGNHIENRFVKWEKLENKDIPKEKIIIALITDVNVGDYIDGIWTIAGKQIKEHAVWIEALNVGLKAYWDFNTNGTDVTGGGSNCFGTGTHNDVDGILGGYYYFDSSLEQGLMCISNGGVLNVPYNFTVSLWAKFASVPAPEGLFSLLSNSTGTIGHEELNIFAWGNNALGFEFRPSGGSIDGSGTNAPTHTNEWTHIVMSYNGTSITMWNNGTLFRSMSASGVLNYTGTPNITIGKRQIVSTYFTGGIDEVGLWNRSLSNSEISDLYNNGNGITYSPTAPDSIAPETTIPIITPQNPKSSDNLQCNATLTDNMQTSLTAYWKWYKNNAVYLSGSSSVTNETNSLITTLNAGNATKGEQWICEITPNDGYNNGTALNSSSVTILNSPPNQTNPLLSTLSGKNLSTENLTCYNKSTSDADNDAVVNIYNWYKNSQPLAVLNMPFEINANDYSGNDNDGNISGAIFTNGKIGKALSFDGVNDYVDIPSSASMSGWTAGTIEMWLYLNSTPTTYVATYADIRQSDTYRIHTAFYSTAKPRIALISEGGANIIAESPEPLSLNTWYHVVGTFDASTDESKIWVNGVLKKTNTTAFTNLVTTANDYINMGGRKGTSSFNGSIDEVKVYPYALTPEQISANYNLEYNKIVNQETTAGDNYMCQVTPNDGEEDGATKNSSVAEIKWAITFNITSGEDGSQINSLDNIVCNNSWSSGSVSSPFEFGFEPGSYECTFSKTNYYEKTIIFNANNDKLVEAKLSYHYHLTVEEHTWLEAIYNCLYSGDCSLYNLLLEVNQTVGKIWENTKPTDNSVITFENITNNVVDSAHNLTMDYTVNIPIKAGYSLGTYLPVRIGYWFLNNANTTCYNQGNKPIRVEEPYCQPLIIETLGPMGGSVSFNVKLHPELPAGNYSIKRIIDIDPNNVWINYGQELVSTFTMAESLTNYGISVEKTGENNPTISSTSSQTTSSNSGGNSGNSVTNVYNTYNVTNIAQENKTKDNTNKPIGITGSIIGTLLSKGNIIISLGVLSGLFISFIIFRTIIKLKKR